VAGDVEAGTLSIQERYNPQGTCYGCGPANPVGLHLRSYPDGDAVVADVVIPATHENGYGIANGGIITTLLDCHTGAVLVHEIKGYDWAEHPPFLTFHLDVSLQRPTPIESPLRIVGRLEERRSTELIVAAEMLDDAGTATARMRAGWRPVLRRL
jgi:acyl-coenzyme A thioesterase PaaI-like protein